MAIGTPLVGTGTGGASAVHTAPTKHASTAVGDLLVYFLLEGRTAGLVDDPTTPSDWARPAFLTNALNTVRLGVYTKIDDGTAVPAIVRGSNTPAWLSNVLSIPGVDTTTPIEVAGTPSDNAAELNAIDLANGITTLAADAMVLAIGGKENDWVGGGAGYNATTDVPTLGTVSGVTFAEAFEAATTSGSDLGLVVDYGTKATAGSIAASSFTGFTSTGSTPSIGVYLSVKPAVAGAYIPRHPAHDHANPAVF